MIEVIIVSLAAVLVALETPAAVGRGMVLDAGGGLSDAQHTPGSFRRVPGQPILAVQILSDVDDFGRIDDRAEWNLDRVRPVTGRAGEVRLLGPVGKTRRAAHAQVGDARRVPGEHAVEL